MTAYSLMDGELQAAAHPDTFEMPSAKLRHALDVGDNVKLGFEPHRQSRDVFGERMWVKITRVVASGYEGELVNIPICAWRGLEIGDLVRFEPKHVLDVFTARGIAEHIRAEQGCGRLIGAEFHAYMRYIEEQHGRDLCYEVWIALGDTCPPPHSVQH